MIIKWVQALKKRRKRKNRNHQNKLTLPISFSFSFFKVPSVPGRNIYLNLHEMICSCLFLPGSSCSIMTNHHRFALFFLNFPPICINHLLNNPSLKEKQNVVLIYEHAVWMTVVGLSLLPRSQLYWIALYCTKSGFQCWHSNKRQGDVSSCVDFSVSGFIMLFALLLFLNVPILFMCVWALASVTVSLPAYGAHLF